jgi:hypothetical protein
MTDIGVGIKEDSFQLLARLLVAGGGDPIDLLADQSGSCESSLHY